MTPLHTHLKNTAQTHLSPSEKSRMREALLSIMGESSVRSPYFFTAYHLPRFVSVGAVVCMLVLTVSTTAYAANDALPGDPLYPLKVHVNERVESALAVTDEAKAKVNVRLAEERIREAERLALMSRLSTTTAAEIQKEFDEHAAQATAYTKKVSTKDAKRAANLSQTFSVSLDTHGKVLEKLSEAEEERSEKREEKGSRKLSEYVRARAERIKEEVRAAQAEREEHQESQDGEEEDSDHRED